MNETFQRYWSVTNSKFTLNTLEWLAWCGQPMLYDGGLCVNRSPEEHQESLRRKGSLTV
jgi:uncharacterized protein YaeQ